MIKLKICFTADACISQVLRVAFQPIETYLPMRSADEQHAQAALADAAAHGQGQLPPFSSILWKGSARRSSQPAIVSWESRDLGSTRIPMEEISNAWPSTVPSRGYRR